MLFVQTRLQYKGFIFFPYSMIWGRFYHALISDVVHTMAVMFRTPLSDVFVVTRIRKVFARCKTMHCHLNIRSDPVEY
jgi:hypothetical protein